MKAAKTQDRKPGLPVVEAYRYFLKGNLLFALNGIVVYTIDSVAIVFPPLFQQVYTDNIITHKNPEWFTPLMTLYVLLFLLELFIWLAFSIIRRKSQARINISSSSNYLWTVLRLPMTLFSQFSPGELVARYTTIPRTIRQIDFTLPSITALFFPAICCFLVTLFNWKLGILAIFSIVLLFFVMRFTTKVQKRIAMDMEVTNTHLQNVTMTGMGNLETIKSLGGERYFFAQWEKAYSDAINARVKTTTNSVYISSVPVLVLELTNCALLCLGTWFILQGELTPGMLLASQGLINRSFSPIKGAIDSMQTMLRLTSSIQRIKEEDHCQYSDFAILYRTNAQSILNCATSRSATTATCHPSSNTSR